jgi:hypothetical protein
MHAVVAMRRGPHWLLSDPDAKAYGTALANALRHLPVTMAQKYVDFAALGVAIVAYEGPRMGIDMQLRAQRQAGARRPPQGPAQVFQFTPRQAGPEAPAEVPPDTPPPMPGDMTYEPQLEA